MNFVDWDIEPYSGPAFIDTGIGLPEKIDIKNGLMVKDGYFYQLSVYPKELAPRNTIFLIIPYNKDNPKPDIYKEILCLLNYEYIENRK